jgi:hypothetical protein
MPAKRLKWATKLAYLEMLRRLPDAAAVSLDYFRVFGRFPNLANPKRFSEKMQLQKLRDHDARTPDLVDKVKVKEYVANTIGAHWLIPTLWHGEHLTPDILRDLPKPAVVKANHSSAQIKFVNDNSNLQTVAREANAWLAYDHHLVHREWAYGNVRRQLLVEPFIGETEAPSDYKFWVFDGAVRFVQVDHTRFTKHTRQFYSPSWKRPDLKMNYPEAPAHAPAPAHLDQMLEAASRLADGFRFVRVDLYDLPQRPLFGEMTFSPEAGLCRFEPAGFDLELGESWSYPEMTNEAEQLRSFSDAFKIRKHGE